MAWRNQWFEWTQFWFEGSFSPTFWRRVFTNNLEKFWRRFYTNVWIQEFVSLFWIHFYFRVWIQQVEFISRYVSRSHGSFSHELNFNRRSRLLHEVFGLVWSSLIRCFANTFGSRTFCKRSQGWAQQGSVISVKVWWTSTVLWVTSLIPSCFPKGFQEKTPLPNEAETLQQRKWRKWKVRIRNNKYKRI